MMARGEVRSIPVFDLLPELHAVEHLRSKEPRPQASKQ